MDDQPIIEIGSNNNSLDDQKGLISAISSPSEISLNDEDKTEDDEQQLELIYHNLIELFEKLQFRKIINSIVKTENLSHCKSYWRINHLKLVCIQKIIERKLRKYHTDKVIPKITNWLRLFDKEISLWYTDLAFKTDDKEVLANKVELYITFVLGQCYNYAKYCIHQSFLTDCIGFLALGERLIKNTSDFFVSPDSYAYAQSIYLFLSSLYIANENFETAKKYVIIVMKIAYKEFELRLKGDIGEIVCLDEYTKQENDCFMKIFFNITVAFFQLGVCYENEAELEKCYHAYKQAKWFGKTVKMNKASTFTDILFDIEERARIRSSLVDFFHKEEANVPDSPKREVKKNILVFNEEEKLKKFSKVQQFIENLKLNEVDDDETDLLNNINEKPFSQRVGVVTKTIHVLNYLMSEKFQNVLDKMNKLEINYLDKDTKRTIQKKIISIKNNERMRMLQEEKEREEKKEMLHKSNKYLHQKPNTYLSTITTNNSSSRANTAASIRFREKEKEKEKKNQSMIKKRPKSSKQSNNGIEKIKYSTYLFNGRFQKKLGFLDNQYNKELKFQKDMLRCKEEERVLAYEPFNERKINHTCENFFATTLKREMKSAKEREKLLKKKEVNRKASVIQKRIKQNFTFKNVKNNRESLIYKLNTGNMNAINQTFLNTIQNDLDIIDQQEKNYQVKLRTIRGRSAHTRNSKKI